MGNVWSRSLLLTCFAHTLKMLPFSQAHASARGIVLPTTGRGSAEASCTDSCFCMRLFVKYLFRIRNSKLAMFGQPSLACWSQRVAVGSQRRSYTLCTDGAHG